MSITPLSHESIWFEKSKCDEAERQYYEMLAKGSSNTPNQNSLAGEVAKARQHIKNSLECMDGIAALATNVNFEVVNRLTNLEKENTGLVKMVNDMRSIISGLVTRVIRLEAECGGSAKVLIEASGAKPAAVEAAADDGCEVDLFGSESEEESEEALKVKEARLAAYAAKKSKKPLLIAKSNIILDVKPWDDETDMKAMETAVKAVVMDGLLWGASKLVPLAYGIHKLQISCVVEDELVSIDLLQETLEGIEDYIQSVDIAAFNKV